MWRSACRVFVAPRRSEMAYFLPALARALLKYVACVADLKHRTLEANAGKLLPTHARASARSEDRALREVC